MFNKKKRNKPATFNESFNEQSDRFYRVFKVNTSAKVVMTSLAVVTLGFSFYNIYDQYQNSEGMRDHIAIIRIAGEMGSGSETGDGAVIATALSKAYKNPHAKAIVIEAESGGGGPSDAIMIYRQINALRADKKRITVTDDRAISVPQSSVLKRSEDKVLKELLDENKAKNEISKQNLLSVLSSGQGDFVRSTSDQAYKPIIVSIKGLCASACYYAVSPADAIYADGNALIGSIGVRMDHWDVSQIMNTVGVKNEPLIAGEFKDALDPYHALTNETREFMQKEILDSMHQKFISDVELGRGNKLIKGDAATAAALYSGRIWPTPTAIKYGLVDGDLTSVEIRSRLSDIYETDSFKNYNEPQRNLRSALGMLASLTASFEKISASTGKIVDSVESTSHPLVR